MIENKELELAHEFVRHTDRHIFLTGKAGTGKTTFLHSLKEKSPKRMVVVAPTGVAAINAGGVTIHSFFQLPFGPILPGRLSEDNKNSRESAFIHKFSKKKINIIRSIDLLVIDEVSMVRADLLDGIDQVLKRFRDRRQPFGGVQLLMIGDLQQLPPVVKQDEWQLLRPHYDSMFFFSSKAFGQCNPVTIELKHIYRQQEEDFIRILNEIRENRLSAASAAALNERVIPGFRPRPEEGYILLTTHNAKANRINDEELGKLTSPPVTFEAEVEGNFPEHAYPADPLLTLKVGARVMFIKNDRSPEKRYFNGKTGMVSAIEDGTVFVTCVGEDGPIPVEREMWENVRYSIDERTKEIREELAGAFYQHPLRLAWAITIHKSQGLTFDRAVIDAQAAFAHGQTYVALSRCRTLDGLVMSSPLAEGRIIQDGTVLSFTRAAESNTPDERVLNDSKRAFTLALLEELHSYRQVAYHLDKWQEAARANRNILTGNVEETARTMNEKGVRVLEDVGQRFMAQMRQITAGGDPARDALFQERVVKAAAYFLEKTTAHLSGPLDACSFGTDNAALEKELAERELRILELLEVKKACLRSLDKGFDITSFLNVRAVASVQDYSRKPSARKTEEPATIEHPVLMKRLREWRAEEAARDNIPAYRIAPQKLLVGIANNLPSDRTQLKSVKGMGPKKLNQYGDDLLAIVRRYKEEFDLEDHEFPLEVPVKKEKKSTFQVTFEMVRQGRTIPEIAAERKLTEQTVEAHVARFVRTGQLDLDAFVSKAVKERVAAFFDSHPEAMLSEAREALGDSITWSDLKLVRAYLEYLKEG